MIVKLKAVCLSKKETVNGDEAYPVATAIELSIPQIQNSPYSQIIGATSFMINTIDPSTAAAFTVGTFYEVDVNAIV